MEVHGIAESWALLRPVLPSLAERRRGIGRQPGPGCWGRSPERVVGEQQLPPPRLPARCCQAQRARCPPAPLRPAEGTRSGAPPKPGREGLLSSTPDPVPLVAVCGAKEQGGGLLAVARATRPAAQPALLCSNRSAPLPSPPRSSSLHLLPPRQGRQRSLPAAQQVQERSACSPSRREAGRRLWDGAGPAPAAPLRQGPSKKRTWPPTQRPRHPAAASAQPRRGRPFPSALKSWEGLSHDLY